MLTIVSLGGGVFLSGGGHALGEDRAGSPTAAHYAEIRVVDSDSGRGIPLVELEMVNGLLFVTDNAGRVAFREPGLMGTEVFFTVRSHGYEMKKDGFGFSGVKVTPRPGEILQIKLRRINLAERMCRLTGEGLYRDSVLLGYEPPIANPLIRARVAGQDSIQAAIYQNKVFWLWGDTLRMEYPLGLFRMAGATTPIPDADDPRSDPAAGIAYEYFIDEKSGFARPMMPLPERPQGVVWLSSLCTVPDDEGIERLVGYYSRRKGLADAYEQGIAIFDDEKSEFVVAKQISLDEKWRFPDGHPIAIEEAGTRWILFGSPTPNVRVPATLEAVLNPEHYEAFTCVLGSGDEESEKFDLDSSGKPLWRWQRQLPPVTSMMEHEWVEAGKLMPADAHFIPADSQQPEDHVILHRGTVRWNDHRNKWVLVAGQVYGKPSMLGEIWYAEAEHPTGPFRQAVRIVTHDRQSFYNVCHHDFLDRSGGREIYFEGTYTDMFSGNPHKTPRYNYNQILYRLDLDGEALNSAFPRD